MLTETKRTALRKLQDRWLSLPVIRYQIRNHGAHERIAGPTSPTFAEVGTMILPEYEQWFRDFFT